METRSSGMLRPQLKEAEPRRARFEQLQNQVQQLRTKPFWQRRSLDERIALRAADAELRELMHELGVTPDQMPSGVLADEFDFLDPARREAIERAVPVELREAITQYEIRAAQGSVESEDYHQYGDHLRAKEDLLLQNLTTAEMSDYIARHSGEGDALRLHAIDLSEDEFRAVATIEWQFNREAERSGASDLDSVRRTRDTALQRALGGRLALYERSEDPTYAGHIDAGTDLGLPRDLSDWIYDVQHWVDESESHMADAGVLSEAERTEQLRSMMGEARSALRAELGASFERWATTPSAAWLSRFDSSQE